MRSQCGVCFMAFTNLDYCLRHIDRVHTNPPPAIPEPEPDKLEERYQFCHTYSKGFHRSKISAHMALHEEGKESFCKYCDEGFANKAELEIHITSAHKNLCETCGKFFHTCAGLYAHMKTHGVEREKAYKCYGCKKEFFYKNDLQRHKLTKHMDCRPHLCDFCGKAFTQTNHLARHMKQMHHENKKSRCLVCKKFFKTRHDLKVHTFLEHRGPKRKYCKKSK